ncbi:MAG: acetyl/propionyl/methylcrotonyl-CoA carboxylase subunit alpha, partial [Acidimicrobiales bacterium]
MRILVANRGEIARRIIRTAHRLGHETVAAHADPDASAPFVAEATRAVRLGPADLGESYLSSEALLEAASRTGATAVHPGYGFLSENAAFARAVESAGLVWIGPHPGAIELMGSKIEARRRAAEAGVPTIAGFDSSQDPTELVAAAERIGYPVLVKASAGGGGKGIRVARAPSELRTALAEAAAESMRSFGDDAVIVERLVEQPRHVEVQVVGDRHGGVIELGTRECSLQRRYQKLLEEAPAPNLADATRRGLRESAVALARSIGYDSAGTVEFIVDAESGEHFFLEMNTRLQVEHPVTEAVTGVDLVELMIRAAAGEPVASTGEPVTLRGHAFEVRINAEDPEAGFVPRTGTVSHLVVPDGVRWDSGIEIGTTVTPFYDP